MSTVLNRTCGQNKITLYETMTNNMSSSTKAYIPCIPSQNHNLSFYAWPSHALRSETLAPADVFEKNNL